MSRVTPEAVVWSLQSFRLCNLESLQSLKSRRSLETAFIPDPESGVTPASGVENQSEIWRLESGCPPDSLVWIHSGICSSDSLRSLKSRRSLEVVFTLDPGVWIHSGLCRLDSLRSLEVGVFPESVVTPEFVVWSYSGVWCLE